MIKKYRPFDWGNVGVYEGSRKQHVFEVLELGKVYEGETLASDLDITMKQLTETLTKLKQDGKPIFQYRYKGKVHYVLMEMP